MKKLAVTLCVLALVPMTGAVAVDDATGAKSEDAKKAVASVVKKAVNKVLVVLKNEDLSRLEKRVRVMKIIKPLVNFDLMARRSLPTNKWAAMDAKQRAAFTKLYVEIIKRSYFNRLDLFTAEVVEFSEPVAKKTKKPAYSVVTHIVSKGDRIEVVYALTKTKDDKEKRGIWKVYDFEIEGVSLRSSYRSQYKDFLEDRSLDDLLEQMQEKIDEAKKKESAEKSKKKNDGKKKN